MADIIAASPSGHRSPWHHPSFVIGAVLVALIVGIAVLSLVWTPYEATRMRGRIILAAMSSAC